ncbi:MAG: SEC-C metal-binding domain-containing protein [Lutibacter sp.]|nr:SEC-C metal-binding domain-containing protein [Lutibacter sp.]MDT8417928.1 SEC-C metal-binding domain-containing protein [Lutibacter sp.]
MTTEDFWNKYINENILEIFDTAYDFFSKELPNEFIENYDVGEVILEVKGHHEDAKEFDKVLKFIKLLQDKQPKLYREYFQYFDEFLIDYYGFKDKKDDVAAAFSNFMQYPVQDFDKYLTNFRKLIFFRQIELLENAIAHNFECVTNSEELLSGADYDLAICKFYLTLENLYDKNNAEFSKDEFSVLLNNYGFEFDEAVLLSIEKGLFKPIMIEKIVPDFMNNRKNCLIVLKGYFLRYMKEKNFSFPLSGNLFDNIIIFLNNQTTKKKIKPDLYFSVQANKFEKYLTELSGSFFVENEAEMVSVLWGSVYLYDFLKSYEIINPETHNSFIQSTKLLKGKVIANFSPDLWNFNFVHSWQKPDSISEIEFIEEEKIFRKSFTIKQKTFNQFKNEISEELANIGELSEFIIEGGKNDVKKSGRSLLDDFFKLNPDSEFNGKDDINSKTNIIYEHIRTEKKIGRNDPCVCGSGKKYKKCCG